MSNGRRHIEVEKYVERKLDVLSFSKTKLAYLEVEKILRQRCVMYLCLFNIFFIE